MSPWVRFVEKMFGLPHRHEELWRVERAGEELDRQLEVLRAQLDPLQAMAIKHIQGEEE